MKYDFFHFRWKQFGKLWSTCDKMTLTFALWPWNSLCFVRSSRNMFVQNCIELSAAVNELSCVQRKKLCRKHRRYRADSNYTAADLRVIFNRVNRMIIYYSNRALIAVLTIRVSGFCCREASSNDRTGSRCWTLAYNLLAMKRRQ